MAVVECPVDVSAYVNAENMFDEFSLYSVKDFNETVVFKQPESKGL